MAFGPVRRAKKVSAPKAPEGARTKMSQKEFWRRTRRLGGKKKSIFKKCTPHVLSDHSLNPLTQMLTIGIRTFRKLNCKYLGQGRIQGVTTSHFLYFTKTSQNCIIRTFYNCFIQNWHFYWKSNVSNQITWTNQTSNQTPWKILDAPLWVSFRTL